MKILIIILSLLFINNSFSAELIIDGYGTDNMSPAYNYGENKLFMVWTAKTQNFTNLGVRSTGSCGGTLEIVNGVQNQNIMCESKNEYGNFYIVTSKTVGDTKASVQKFVFAAGTGIWTEFVGADCTGAYSGTKENHFMWKGKCIVPESVMKNAKERIANFKKDQ